MSSAAFVYKNTRSGRKHYKECAMRSLSSVFVTITASVAALGSMALAEATRTVEVYGAERGKCLNSSRQASRKSRSTSICRLFSSSIKFILGDEYVSAITLATFSAFATT